jgi:CelD/BcsL family acetyltransferase involved in cellulose biosynthesis
MKSNLTLEIIRDEASFLALEPHWKALLQLSAITTPFLTWEWTRLWWQHYRELFRLRIGVLRKASGQVEAIAPLVLGHDQTGPRRHLRHLTLLGGLGEVVSEGLDFLIPRGRERELVPQFARLISGLRREWDVVDLPALHEESPNAAPLSRLLELNGRAEQRSAPHNDYVLELSGSWDDVMATVLSGNRRSDYRSKWKKLMANHAGKALVGGRDMPVNEAMESLIGLHRQRFEQVDSSFVSDRALSFHRQLAREWMPEGKVMISMLHAEDRPAAARYGYIHDGRYWDYQSGFDDRFEKVSVGNLNLGWAIQNAIERGLTEYDHLAGEQPYKQVWSTRVRRLLHLECLNPSSPKALLFMLTRFLKRHITDRSPYASEALPV